MLQFRRIFKPHFCFILMVFFLVEAHSYCFHACSQAALFAPTAADVLYVQASCCSPLYHLLSADLTWAGRGH